MDLVLHDRAPLARGCAKEMYSLSKVLPTPFIMGCHTLTAPICQHPSQEQMLGLEALKSRDCF